MHSSSLPSASEEILISGYNLNSGGGKLLLESLLKAAPENATITLFADYRLQNSALDKTRKNLNVIFVKNSLLARILAELKISALSKKFNKHLCLGNLPPIFGSKSSVQVFVHSRYLVDKSLDSILPLKKLLITVFERTWFKLSLRPEYKLIVQTPTMEELLQNHFGPNLNIRVQAFTELEKADSHHNRDESFLYVASIDPHKNHKNLLKSWKLLKDDQLSPKLVLVVSETNKELSEMVAESKLNVDFRINPSREQLVDIYKNSKCLIHPSFFESLGLVLIEAQHFGLDILASETDYVRDIVTPVQTFDPSSAKSIARAVKRYIGNPEAKVPIESPSDFWKKL